MLSGLLRHRLTVQARTPGLDARGQASGAWSTVATLWAEVQTLAGQERLAQHQPSATATHRVVLRFARWLTPQHRLLWQGRTLLIESASDPDGRGRELVVLCREDR